MSAYHLSGAHLQDHRIIGKVDILIEQSKEPKSWQQALEILTLTKLLPLRYFFNPLHFMASDATALRYDTKSAKGSRLFLPNPFQDATIFHRKSIPSFHLESV